MAGERGKNPGQTVVNQGPVAQQFIAQEATYHLPPTPRPVPRKSNLPPRRYPFVGREAELAELHRLLTSGAAVALDQGPTPPSGLTGLGGVGKSTLATEYGYRHHGEYDHICWVNADGTDVTAGIAALADDPLSLGLSPDTPTSDKARTVLARLDRGGPHLLILDNISDPDSYSRLLPQTGSVRVVITTRRTDLHGVRHLSVEVLPEADALQLMLGKLEVSEAERQAGRQLCHELGYLTLAVAVAGRLLETRQRTPSALLAIVREKGPLGMPETRRAKDVLGTSPSVERLFDASVALLDESAPVDAHARRLLWVGGWFAPVEIPPETFFDAAARLVGAPVEEEVARAALERLMDLGLVQVDERGGRGCTGWSGRIPLPREGRKPGRAVLDALGAVAARINPETMALRALVPFTQHLEKAAGTVDGQSQEGHLLLTIRLAQHYRATSRYTDCWAIGAQLAPKLGDTIWASYFYYEAAQALQVLGRLSEAIELSLRSLAISARFHGSEHPDLVGPLIGLALALVNSGREQEALGHYRRVLAILEPVGPEVPEVGVALHAIGQLLQRQGKYAEAMEYFQRDLKIALKHFGPHHPSTANTLHEIGQLLASEGRYQEALDFHRRSLTMKESLLGRDHLEVAFSLHSLGQLLMRQHQVDEALTFFGRSLAIKVGILGAEHPQSALTQIELGRGLRAQGDPCGRQQLLEGVARLERALGPEHPQVQVARNFLR